MPALLQLGPQIVRLQRELDPVPDAGPAPVPEGMRRVRLLGRFHDKVAMGLLRLPGEVVDLDQDDAEEAVQRGFAEAVA